MFYRKIYPSAWQLTKKNPILWFFGLFASLLGFYEIQALFSFSNKFPDFISTNIKSWIDIFITFSIIDVGWSNLSNVLVLLGLFILFSITTIITISSQAALTYSVSSQGKKAGKKSLGKQLQYGVEKFWPVFGLNIINSLVGYFFVTLVVAPLIYFVSNTNSWPVYIILGIFTFFVLIPLVVVISFVTRYGIAFVVIKNQKFVDAFINSWLLFKINWLITLENAFLLLATTFLTMIAIISAIVFIFVPFYIIANALPFLAFMFFIIGLFLIATVLILTTSIYTAFYNIVWATIFLDLIAPGQSYSKIHRVAHKYLPVLVK